MHAHLDVVPAEAADWSVDPFAGVLALAYGGFSYTKDTTAVKLGPLELKVQEKQTVNVPIWAGVGAIVGLALIAFRGRDRGKPVPFGPYLAAAGWICLVAGDFVSALLAPGGSL